MNPDVARLDFLRWLSRFDPKLYRLSIRPQGATGLGALGWINFVIQAVAMVGGAVMQKKQAKKQEALQKKAIDADQASQEATRKDALKVALLDINFKRAQAGLGPVDESGKLIGQASLPPAPNTLAPLYAQAGFSVPATNSFSSPAVIVGGLAGLGLLVYLLRR
jgi:hypothetical protein